MRAVLKILGVAAALVAMGGVALAQGSIQQSGPIVTYHPPAFYANGVVGDGGNNTTPFLSATALFGGTNCPLSVSSQTGPGASLSAYSQVSICQTATATTFTVQGLNGQATPGVFFDIGGVTYPFPGAGGGNVVGPMSSTDGNLACFNGTSGALLKDCSAGLPLPVANGGTASTTAAAARTALGAAPLASPTFTGVATAPSVVTTATTFSGLDATPVAGERAYITDDNSACTFLTIATGGGTTKCPVVYNGTDWVAG